MFSVFVWRYESGRVLREGHSPKCRVLRNFSFQPCRCLRIPFYSVFNHVSLNATGGASDIILPA